MRPSCDVRLFASRPRAESLAIAFRKAVPIAGLILGTRSHVGSVPGVGLLELALSVEIPAVAPCLVFTARLATVDQSALDALLVRIRVGLGTPCQNACQLGSIET